MKWWKELIIVILIAAIISLIMGSILIAKGLPEGDILASKIGSYIVLGYFAYKLTFGRWKRKKK